jgi:putative oxidoreductase
VINQREDIALLAGRLLLASMFLPSGLEKLMSFSKFAATLAAKGLPYAKVWAVLGVAVEVLGPVALIVGAWSRWTRWCSSCSLW